MFEDRGASDGQELAASGEMLRRRSSKGTYSAQRGTSGIGGEDVRSALSALEVLSGICFSESISCSKQDTSFCKDITAKNVASNHHLLREVGNSQ